MADIARLTEMIEPAAEAEGLALVRVKMMGGTSDPTLQIMAERPDTRQLTLEDCARLSRRLSEILDEAEASGNDPIPHAYRLEVSSPGIDRPLTRLKDYDDWKGHEARIVLTEKLNGRKVFSGDIQGTEGETVLVDVQGLGPTGLPFAAINNAKLVMTDRLIAATAPLLAGEADAADEVIEFEGEPEDGADHIKTEED
ncbi:MAG TPA: ribosome maturation protein RimP [Allosphingosinicella sp.]|jgi:ribosome maturation factor RimP